MSLFDEPPPTDHLDVAVKALVEVHGYEEVLTCLRRYVPTEEAHAAPARWADPETSHAAVKPSPDVGRFSSKSRQAKLLQQFAMASRTDQQATIMLLGSHAAPSAFDGCRRRCSDLRAVHYLYDTGKRRRNPGSDDDSIVWGITEAGLQALELLNTKGWSR